MVECRLLGLPIFRRYVDKKKGGERTVYMGGLVDTYRNGASHYRVRILHMRLYARSWLRCWVLFFPCCRLRVRKWLRRLNAQIPKEYDDVYLFRHNIGECIVELMHFKQRIAAVGSAKPLAVARNAVYKELLDMYLPEGVDCCCIPMEKGEIMDAFGERAPLRDKDVVLYCGRRRFICSLPHVDMWMYKLKAHFYEFITGSLKVPEGSPYATPHVSAAVRQTAFARLNELHLSEGRYVLLAPDATSMRSLPNEFWQEIIDSLGSRGYEVLVNAVPGGAFALTGANIIFPSLSELYVLAQYSHSIICMGSGLAVLLVSAGVAMTVLYTDTYDFICAKKGGYSAAQVLSMYTLLRLPHAHSLIHEYNAAQIEQSVIIQQILNHYIVEPKT